MNGRVIPAHTREMRLGILLNKRFSEVLFVRFLTDMIASTVHLVHNSLAGTLIACAAAQKEPGLLQALFVMGTTFFHISESSIIRLRISAVSAAL